MWKNKARYQYAELEKGLVRGDSCVSGKGYSMFSTSAYSRTQLRLLSQSSIDHSQGNILS